MQVAGGPHIPLRYGRTDTVTEEEVAPEGRLPGARSFEPVALLDSTPSNAFELSLGATGHKLCILRPTDH